MSSDYVFAEHTSSAEHDRLLMLEKVHDSVTTALLEKVGLGAGATCAEKPGRELTTCNPRYAGHLSSSLTASTSAKSARTPSAPTSRRASRW